MTRWLTNHSFQTIAFELSPLHCFRKRYIVRKIVKKEVANISRHISNLRRFWVVKAPVHELMARHKSG